MTNLSLESIIKTIKDRGITAYQISKDTPLSEDGINKILNGQSKNPRKTTLLILYDYLFKEKVRSTENEEDADRFEDIVAKRVLQEFHPAIQKVLESHDEIKKEVAKLILDVDDLMEENQELIKEIQDLKKLNEKTHSLLK